jgi:hypothetical protein
MMRRRFGRRRWGGGGGGGDEGGGGRPLDAAQELARVLRLGLVPADALEPVSGDDVPARLGVAGTGTSRDGEALVVGVAPQGGDAWLAALAVATRIEGFRGTALAIAPSWSLAARRRLGLLRMTPFNVDARREPVAGAAEGGVEAEPLEPALATGASAVAPTEPHARALFERSQLALAGLAAKHGGAARGAPGGTELVLLGRTVAVLRSDASSVSLELREGRRETARLAPDNVAETFDRLEGSLRKFLGDRRSREGDEAARFVLADALLVHLAPRASLRWPLPGDPGDALDFAAVDERGAGLAGFARGTLGLLELGGILDAWAGLVPALPALVPGAGSAAPALVVAAEQLLPAAQRVLALIDADVRWLEASRRGREPSFAPRELPAPSAAAREPWSRPVEPPPASRAPVEPRAIESRPIDQPVPEEQPVPAPIAAAAAEPVADTAGRRPYEEFSLFDLGEGGGEEAAPGGDGRRRRRRRRGRGRGRGGAPPSAAREEDADGDADEEEEPRARSADDRAERGDGRGESRGRDRERGRRRDRRDRPERPPQPTPIPDADPAELEADAEADDDVELDDQIAELAEIPEIEAPEPTYDEDEEGEEEGGPEDDEGRRLRQEREQRRLARLAKGDPEAEAAPPPRPPRRRAAILAHADRESVAAAVLLARDIRLIEGIWIYPQEDLMTFFRNVATDLREDTPIVVVGFTARPLRETLQTASLYRDRLVWYDHHEWPPEDVGAMKSAIGVDNVHVDAAAGSALAVVLSVCTRRSRFSDKLVDLLTGRFTAHDYARWGRLWWSRLAQLAARHGERRTELEGLLVGRPSDLAKQAARVAPPPVPEEVGWVAARDFRIVHFGGHALVRVPVPPELDLHLAARIARERYRASLSLGWTEGTDRFVLCGDEVVARRPLDVAAMIEHLDAKFAWVSALPDPDHVARMRIADAAAHPDRVDEVVTEIAMGRSLLEG